MNEQTLKSIGKNIRRARVYRGMKQQSLAIHLGISQQTISKIEQQVDIDEGLLGSISKELGFPADFIKKFDDEILLKQLFNHRSAPTIHIGRKIEAIRRLRKITQTQLGNALGVTKQSVSKMEKTENIKDE